MPEQILLEMDLEKPLRVALKFKVQDIPGDPPSRRANVVADAFLNEFFKRNFCFGNDWMHVPCNIDAIAGSTIFVLDINAKNNITVTADSVPLKCYLVKSDLNQTLYD